MNNCIISAIFDKRLVDLNVKNNKCFKRGCKNETDYKYCMSCLVELSRKSVQKEKDKKWTQRKKAYKEIKTDYYKLLQTEINKIARYIDHDQLCISCQKIPKKKNGCHFKSVGGHENIRYNLLNIYLGCERCNKELGGNVHGYDDGLILVFGKEFWEYLKFQLFQDFKLLQIREETVKEKLKIARKIVSELENNLEKNNTEKRLELRKMYNERIGIYNHIPIW